MSYIRFPKLAKMSGGKNIEVLSANTGYGFEKDGDDLVISTDDPKLKQGPQQVLKTEPRAISINKPDEIASTFTSRYIAKELETAMKGRVPKKIEILDNFGLLSQIQVQKNRFFFANASKLKEVLVNDLIPFVKSEMAAKYVFPLTVDANYQQGLISLNRLVFSMGRFSPEEIAGWLDEGKIFDAMLPTPLNILSYPEALLVFSPFAVSLPFNRVGSQLHFFNDNIWMFPYYMTEGIFEKFSSAQEPIPVSYAEDYLGLYMLGSHGARRYFMAAIEAVNSLLKYLNNPLNFLEKDGIINHKRLLQSHSAIHLMFADLIALNFTNSRYSKTRYVLSFLDKMANLCAAFHGKTGNKEEAAIFNRLLSDDFGGRLSKMLDHHLKKTYDKLGRCMSGAASKLYSKISEHPESKESLRTIRNSSHGSFLSSAGFEKILFSDFEVPYEMAYLPMLMMWGLALDYEYFMGL